MVKVDDSQDEDYKFRLVTLAGTYLNGTALANTPTKNSKTKECSKKKKVFVVFLLILAQILNYIFIERP